MVVSSSAIPSKRKRHSWLSPIAPVALPTLAVVMPPVDALPLAVVVPPVTVIVLHRRVTLHLCPAESCRPSLFCRLPSSCRPLLPSCHVIASPVAVIVPRLRAACFPAAHCRHRVARRFHPHRCAAHRHRRATRCHAAPCHRCAARCRRCSASLCRLLPSTSPALPSGGVPWLCRFVCDWWDAVLILRIPT